MYSIVMVAAMTVAPATPEWGLKHGSCYGNSCGGCYGGAGYGGCYGSCHGAGWGFGGCQGAGRGFGGCLGGGWGCHGTATVHSGCSGGWGQPVAPYAGLAFSGCTGHGSYYTGCMGYGSYYAPAAPIGYYGMTTVGVGGTYVVPNGGFTPVIPAAGVTVPATGAGTTTPGAGSSPGAPSGGKGGISVPGTPERVGLLPANRAQVVVRAPASAKLYAEGQATSLTGTERVFLTPELSGTRDFQYTLKLEDGTETTTRQVVVRAGHRTVVDFTTPGVEKASSTVTVNLPANAKLFVDGVPAAVAGGTRTFRTPELAKGQPFVYEFRAEVEKDGTTEVLSKKVTFTAGEPVTVDFVEPTAVRTASR